ncbi:hypothetical protein ACFLSS_02450 [Bacteroidota bacterium]
MKIFFIAAIFLLNNSLIFAQVELKGDMGIYFFSSPSMQDYINQSGFDNANNQLASFVSSIVFAGEGGVFVSPDFIVTLEAAYQIYSYTNTGISGQYDLSFNNIMPSFLAYFVVSGVGYNFKFGGGAGLRLVNVDEARPASSSNSFSSVGIGIIGRVEGNTLLGGSVYANVGLDIRYDVNGEPDSNGTTLRNNVLNENVNFNSLSFGIRLGISYIFGEVN